MNEPARVTLPGGADRPATINNISAGGARIQVTAKLHYGDVIGLTFGIGPENQYVAAEVVHASKEDRGFHYMCGLRFVGLDPRDAHRIASYVDEEQQRRRVGFAPPRS